jgi:hypothetical protein
MTMMDGNFTYRWSAGMEEADAEPKDKYLSPAELTPAPPEEIT